MYRVHNRMAPQALEVMWVAVSGPVLVLVWFLLVKTCIQSRVRMLAYVRMWVLLSDPGFACNQSEKSSLSIPHCMTNISMPWL